MTNENIKIREEINDYLMKVNFNQVQHKPKDLDHFQKKFEYEFKLLNNKYVFSGTIEITLNESSFIISIFGDNFGGCYGLIEYDQNWRKNLTECNEYIPGYIVGEKIYPKYIQYLIGKFGMEIEDFSIFLGVSPETMRDWLSGINFTKNWKKRALLIQMNEWSKQKAEEELEKKLK
jgi:hypothetical protein